MIRILHTADFHLDSPFAALPDSMAIERRREQRELLSQIAVLAEDADIVLLSGDLFDSGRAYVETVEALSDFYSKIKARIFISPGNHDYYAPKSPYSHMKKHENVHVFTGTEPCGIEIPELGCVVWGAAFLSERAEPPLRGFKVPENGKINIMTLHGDTSFPDSPYGYISQADIAETGLDYLALGHVHGYGGIQKSGRTFWAYPGCVMGRGFDETGTKGILKGTVGKGICDLKFIPLSARKYELLSIDISKSEDISSTILAVLPEGTVRDVYRITLTGDSAEKPKLEEIRSAIAHRFGYVELRDMTRLCKDVWEAAGEDTLKGNFLRILRNRYDTASDEAEREEISLAARFGLAALEYREEI